MKLPGCNRKKCDQVSRRRLLQEIAVVRMEFGRWRSATLRQTNLESTRNDLCKAGPGNILAYRALDTIANIEGELGRQNPLNSPICFHLSVTNIRSGGKISMAFVLLVKHEESKL
jgi:hypothetical protein